MDHKDGNDVGIIVNILEKDLQKSESSLCSSSDIAKIDGEMFEDSFLALRKVMVEWYESIAIHYQLSRRTLALAISYFDRYCNVDETCRRDKVGNLMRLSGIVCLILATKMDNVVPIALGMVSHLSCNTFDETHGRMAEHCILRGLKFNLTPPLACDIIEGLTMTLLVPVVCELHPSKSKSKNRCFNDHSVLSDPPRCKASAAIKRIHQSALRIVHAAQRDRVSLDFQPHILALSALLKAARPRLQNKSFEELRVGCEKVRDSSEQWELIVQCCTDLDCFMEDHTAEKPKEGFDEQALESEDDRPLVRKRNASPTSVANVDNSSYSGPPLVPRKKSRST